jgi:hypothetical protein
VLRNPVYCGYVFNKSKKLIKSKVYQPIISQELYDNVQKYWNTIKRVHDPAIQFEYSEHQTSSIIKCVECKGNFIHEYTKSKTKDGYKVYDYYFAKHKDECSRKEIGRNYLPAVHIDNIFSTLYYLTFSDRSQIEQLYKEKERELNKEKERNNYAVGQLEKKIQEKTKSKMRLLQFIERTDNINFSDERIVTLNDQIKELEVEKEQINKKEKMIEEKYQALFDEFKENSLLSFIHSNANDRRQILLKMINSCIMKDLIITAEFITGRKFEIEVPQKKRFETPSDIYKIKILDGIKNRVNDFVLHAKKSILRYGPGRNDFKLVMRWVKDTEKAIKQGKGIKPLS